MVGAEATVLRVANLPMTADAPAAAGTIRARVVDRAIGAASERATARVDRFLDAAFDLLERRSPATDFSVQEVVDRSGQSLRTFYGSYRGRHELLLAVLEASVATTVERLSAAARDVDPVDRLHVMVVELHRGCRSAPRRRGRPLPATLVLQLLGTDPVATGRLLEPLVTLFDAACRDAVDVGATSGACRSRSVAASIVQIVLLDELSGVIAPLEGFADDPAEEVWALISGGLVGLARQGRRGRG